MFQSKLQARLDLTNEKLIKGRLIKYINHQVAGTKKSSNSTWRRDDLVYQTVDYVCKYGGFYESKGKRKGRL